MVTTEILLSVPKYDFNWQTTYLLKSPKLLPAGTRLVFDMTWDNSAQNPANPDPTRTVPWGDQTWDEMNAGGFDIVTRMKRRAKRRPAAVDPPTPGRRRLTERFRARDRAPRPLSFIHRGHGIQGTISADPPGANRDLDQPNPPLSCARRTAAPRPFGFDPHRLGSERSAEFDEVRILERCADVPATEHAVLIFCGSHRSCCR